VTYGFELACRALAHQGVRHVFGVPGTQSVHFYEGLRRSQLHTVLMASESGAAFAAGAYGRITGRPGVLVTIPGPGFAYAVPGLAEARLDSAPLVHLTWAPPARGRAFDLQAIDQTGVVAPLVKRVISVVRTPDVEVGVAAAFQEATSGEPGPVVVQFTPETMTDEGSGEPAEAGDACGATVALLDEEATSLAGARLAAARRPVILAGQGALAASRNVQDLAERATAPVLTTPSARGIVPEDHPLALGFDVPRGDVGAVNALLAEADLVLVLGAKLGHNGSVGFSLRLPADRTVRVDASTEVLRENYPVSLAVRGDVAAYLKRVGGITFGGGWSQEAIAEWRGRILARRTGDSPDPALPGLVGGPAAFFAALRAAVPRDAILVTDSGLHQVAARRHYASFAPSGLLFPSDFQSMGFGLPAAIAAKLAAPARAVVVLIGDGGLQMSGFELATAVRERLPLPVFVFNDGRLGLIRLEQITSWGRTHDVDLQPLDLAAFAAAVGAGYALVGDGPGEAVTRALAADKPTLLEVRVADSGRMLSTWARRAGSEWIRGWLPAWLRRLVR